MHLDDLWFALTAFLWTGYFLLEGSAFGIGILSGLLARDSEERGVLLATLGPVRNGNTVWMLTAVGATFAAFPGRYAALSSGFRLPVLAVAACLVVRGAALGHRAGRDDERWRRACDRSVFWSSLTCAFLWGALFATVVRGVPVGPDGTVTGGALLLANPDAAFGGLASVALFTLHGALFAALRTRGALRARARSAARRAGVTSAALALFSVYWLLVRTGGIPVAVTASVVAFALVVVSELGDDHREGWAFALSGLVIAAVTGTVFCSLHPALLRVAAFAAPVVIAYQAWTCRVFRKRIGAGRR
ncbi:cytochrome d ubiquinol oxidase subunit II [Streptomyces sp. NPDC051183]|uniref:cytochrome d ubiquinol oxidase subunit II n=1 Tax=unclassified Streptomyces TaxID=2593676 RepID=UPI00342FA549